MEGMAGDIFFARDKQDSDAEHGYHDVFQCLILGR